MDCPRSALNSLTFALIALLALVMAPAIEAADDNSKPRSTKAVCVSFDELPAARSFGEPDRRRVNGQILATLEAHEVKAAGFVVGESIEDDFDLLGDWLNAGHVLGNLTFSHQDLNSLAPATFVQQIEMGHEALEPMISGFGQKKRYFRYPFMHYGNTVEAKREVGSYLTDAEYIVAHGTILVDDYFYNLALEKLGAEPDSLSLNQIGNEYIDHVMERVHLAEEQAQIVLKRNCRQILVLRANRLNSLVLHELLNELEEDGYGFVTLDEALDDEVYWAPEAYYGNQALGYLEMLRQSNPDLLPAE